MPPTEVKILVEYDMNNPKTGNNIVQILIVGLISGISILLVKGNK